MAVPQLSVFFVLTGIMLHVLLAYFSKLSSLFSSLYAFAMLPLGLSFLVWDKQPRRLINLTAYIAGAEVLWRMTKVGLFWEYGKYAVILFLVLGMLRWRPRVSLMPVIFFLLLVPAVFLTISSTPLDEARKAISFNLAGPLALSVAGLFFSGRKLPLHECQEVFLYTILPIAGIAFLAFFRAYTATDLEFGSQSNFITSGGYGPNQVSGILGLGALLCFVLLMLQERFDRFSWLIAGLLAWFLMQAFLTFSRGGVANFLGAALLATPFFLRNQKQHLGKLLYLPFIVIILAFVLLPKLDAFTGGKMSERFSDTSTTGRWEVIQKDLALWQNNFIFGAGIGQSATERFKETDSPLVLGQTQSLAAHTEYSRLLAEHGLFGLMAMLVLGGMFLQAVFSAPNPVVRGLKIALMACALLAMTHQAMRLVAIAYFFSFSLARFEDDQPCG